MSAAGAASAGVALATAGAGVALAAAGAGTAPATAGAGAGLAALGAGAELAALGAGAELAAVGASAELTTAARRREGTPPAAAALDAVAGAGTVAALAGAAETGEPGFVVTGSSWIADARPCTTDELPDLCAPGFAVGAEPTLYELTTTGTGAATTCLVIVFLPLSSRVWPVDGDADADDSAGVP